MSNGYFNLSINNLKEATIMDAAIINHPEKALETADQESYAPVAFAIVDTTWKNAAYVGWEHKWRTFEI